MKAWITLKKNASGFQNVLVSQDVREPSVVTQAYKSVRAKMGLGTVSCTGGRFLSFFLLFFSGGGGVLNDDREVWLAGWKTGRQEE